MFVHLVCMKAQQFRQFSFKCMNYTKSTIPGECVCMCECSVPIKPISQLFLQCIVNARLTSARTHTSYRPQKMTFLHQNPNLAFSLALTTRSQNAVGHFYVQRTRAHHQATGLFRATVHAARPGGQALYESGPEGRLYERSLGCSRNEIVLERRLLVCRHLCYYIDKILKFTTTISDSSSGHIVIQLNRA